MSTYIKQNGKRVHVQAHTYTYEPGRTIARDGKAIAHIDTYFSNPDFSTYSALTPVEGDDLTRRIVDLLNAQEAAAKAPERVPLYVALARVLEAHARSQEGSEWRIKHAHAARWLARNCLPSGSGWDNGTRVDWAATKPDHIVLFGSFRHMNENGMYDGWTDHTVIVRPSLSQGCYIRITGRNRNDIKSYLHEVFDFALRAMVDPHAAYKAAAEG